MIDRSTCLAGLAFLAMLAPVHRVSAQETDRYGALEFVDATSLPDLQNVVGIDIPRDGKFIYTAAYNAKAVFAFQRDPDTGKLGGVQSLSDTEKLDGVTGLRLSPDGRHAATAAFRSHATTLMQRDAQDGSLQIIDSALQRDNPLLKMVFAIGLEWSPDSRFIYVIAPSSGAVNVFGVENEALKLVQVHTGENNCFSGARGIALSPDGSLIYVTSEVAGTLAVLQRDARSGAMSLKQVLRDEQGGVRNLAGAFSVAVSPDGQFVYASAGRFRGDQAISVFRLREEGDLALVQELVNGTADLEAFVGGNEILITPDGRNAYAVASRSHSLVTFRRDPATGKLTQLQALVHKKDGVGPLEIVSGLGLSPDGKFIYAAAEGNNAISIFRRSLPAGAAAPAVKDKD